MNKNKTEIDIDKEAIIETDPVYCIIWNIAIEAAANAASAADGATAIESIRQLKKPENIQQDFIEAIKRDPYMLNADKRFWLSDPATR